MRSLGVELDDEALFEGHRERDLVAFRDPDEGALDLVLVPVEVPGRIGRDLDRFSHRDEVRAPSR